MRRILRDNGLTITATTLFLGFLLAQSVTGMRAHNGDQKDHDEPTVSYGEYLRTAHFGEATFENFESEFLQMGAFVLLTVKLRQKGSAESKGFGPEDVDEDPAGHRDDAGAPWPVRKGGLLLELYGRSLSTAFFVLFGLAWLLHAVTGAREYSADQVAHGGAPVTTFGYIRHAQFWFESFQNWQSEFLAVASIVVLTIFLRQYGSSESKPVAAPHALTGR
jgi:hypothetical protein